METQMTTNNIKVLVACEESQAVTKEIRKLGVQAWSCDIQECSGGHSEWHIQGDAIKEAYSGKYDMMIAFPPCTFLSLAGSKYLYKKDGSKNLERWKNRELALDFVKTLMDAPIDYICIENPVSVISSQIRKPDQIIQPYWFGDAVQKRTCLWLKNLPHLKSTKIVDKGEFVIGKKKRKNGKEYKMSKWLYDCVLKSKNDSERRKLRSKTFPGIAQAMAKQWIPFVLKQQNNYGILFEKYL